MISDSRCRIVGLMRNRSENDKNASMPTLAWRKATCRVCGETFDYSSRRAPATCRSGECRYKYHYKIDTHKWADYQPTLFDR